MISHFQVQFLGLWLAARNILFNVFHILTPSDVASEKSFSFMVAWYCTCKYFDQGLELEDDQ